MPLPFLWRCAWDTSQSPCHWGCLCPSALLCCDWCLPSSSVMVFQYTVPMMISCVLQVYQSWLDKSTPFAAVRWAATLILTAIYMIRVYILQVQYSPSFWFSFSSLLSNTCVCLSCAGRLWVLRNKYFMCLCRVHLLQGIVTVTCQDQWLYQVLLTLQNGLNIAYQNYHLLGTVLSFTDQILTDIYTLFRFQSKTNETTLYICC